MTHLRAIVGPLLIACFALACDSDPGDKAKDKAKEIAEKAKDKGQELAENAKDKGQELAGEAKDKTSELWEDKRPDTGELSERAKGIFTKGAEDSDTGVEAWLDKGIQVAPVAFEIAKTVHSAIDSDTSIEPIVQKLDDDDAQGELDARIKDMPRVETIDGVQVGFKDVKAYDSGGRETESAYLVLWRSDDRLVGFIYRSKSRINVDELVEEAPRIIGLVKGVL